MATRNVRCLRRPGRRASPDPSRRVAAADLAEYSHVAATPGGQVRSPAFRRSMGPLRPLGPLRPFPPPLLLPNLIPVGFR
jgi:hypothetical protein